MKVLITGCTPLQVNSPRRRNDYRDNTHAMLAALQDAGEEVVWGHPLEVVKHKEAGAPFDVVFAGLCDPRSMVANQIYDLAYALEYHESFGRRYVFYFDDWRLHKCLTAFRWMRQRQDLIFKPSFEQRREYLDRSPGGGHPLKRLLDRLSVPEGWPLTTASMFDFGTNKPMLRDFPLRQLERVNLQSYYPRFGYETEFDVPPRKSRAWMYGALWDYDAWVKSRSVDWTWPVEVVGPKYRRTGEQEFVDEMASRWGHLSPPYGSANGTGWARPRWWYAAHTGTIIAGDPKELGPWLPAYDIKPQDVEELTDPELRDVALHQAVQQVEATCSRYEVQRRLMELAQGRSVMGDVDLESPPRLERVGVQGG